MHLKGWDLHRYHPNSVPNSFVQEDDIIKTIKILELSIILYSFPMIFYNCVVLYYRKL